MLLARLSAQFSILPAVFERVRHQFLLSHNEPATPQGDQDKRFFSAALHSHAMCGVLSGYDFAQANSERDAG